MLRKIILSKCQRECHRGHLFHLRHAVPGVSIYGEPAKQCPHCASIVHTTLPTIEQERALTGTKMDRVNYLLWRWFQTEDHGNTHVVGGLSNKGLVTLIVVALTISVLMVTSS